MHACVSVKGIRGKWVPLIARPFRHDRNRTFAVRAALVEGCRQGFLTRLLAWVWLIFLWPAIAQAECCSARVKYAELVQDRQSYKLSAEIDYYLSDRAMDALQNGVPLFWDIEIEIQAPRDYLWAKTLAETVIRYRLQYHALLNLYRVKNESTGDLDNLSTLPAALDLMSVLRNVPVFGTTTLDLTPANQLAIKIYFDREALPLPMRPMAYLSQQWYLSSEWSLWPLKN